MSDAPTPVSFIDPGTVAALTPEAAQALLIQLAALQPLLIQKALTGTHNGDMAGDLLTVPEVAQRLKLSPYRVYELIRQGHLKRTQLGKKSVRIRPADLAAFVAEQGG